MTDQEVRRLSRKELLELLEKLSQENDQLRSELSRVQAELADRRIPADEMGTMMQAAQHLGQILEEADDAAAPYLEQIRRAREQQP